MKTKNLTFKLIKPIQLAQVFTKKKYQTQNKTKLGLETIFETFIQPIQSL